MKLITFGRLGLEEGALKRQKPLLLLAYLAVEGIKPRRHLAELFFPGTSDPFNSLSRVLTNLRKEAPGSVEADNTRAWITAESDVVQFLNFANAGDWMRCEGIYAGAFAENLALELSSELEEWVLGTREYLASRQREVLLQLGEERLKAKKLKRAASYAERAYSLPEAAELEPEHLRRVYLLMIAGSNPRAAKVREEAETFGIDLPEVSLAAQGDAEAQEHNLPLPKSSFVGRDQELREIALQLANSECRLLTLCGAGGVGKSRLALRAAYKVVVAEQFKDTVAFVPLDALTSVELISTSIARSLDLIPSAQGDILMQVARHIGNKHVLLILDNFEHLNAGATLLGKLLEACPKLKILVTSRERLKLAEEWVYTLAGLDIPENLTEEAGQAHAYDAINLFVQRAKRMKLDFTLSEEDLPHVCKICRLVDGSPLGIELAAGWVRLLQPSEIVCEIEANIDVLEASVRNTVERHRSLRAVFRHSWKLLNLYEQDVLKKLAVFVGGFKREAARDVAGAALPVLADLVDKSLLRVLSNGRYDCHPLIYQFINEKFKGDRNVSSVFQQKHASYYCTYLIGQSDAIVGPKQAHVLQSLEAEADNILSAWPHFFRIQQCPQFYLAVRTVNEFLSIKGRAVHGIKLFKDALKLIEIERLKADQIVLASLYKGVGWFCLDADNIVEAQLYTEKSLALFSDLAYPVETAVALRHLGIIERRKGNYASAKRLYEQELQLHKSIDNLLGVAGVLTNLGLLHMQLEEYCEAESCLIRSTEIDRCIESWGGLANDLEVVGTFYLKIQKIQLAEQAFRESLALTQNLGDFRLMPHVLEGLGKTLQLQGNTKEGQKYMLKARQLNENNRKGAVVPKHLSLRLDVSL